MNFCITALILALLLSIGITANAQQKKVILEPTPAWVNATDFDPEAVPPPGQEGGYYYLLIDEQENTLRQETYLHFAYKVITSDGVQAMSDISIDFDPAYQKLLLHHVTVHREGKKIDQRANAIQVLQREQSMDRFLYDGSLTAVINLRDIRVGDIIEYSYSRRGYNPVYDGHLSRKILFDYTLPYEKFYQRLIIPESLELDIAYRNTDIKPEIKSDGGQKEYIWTRGQTRGLILDAQVPDWYEANQHVMVTDFRDWKEVADWATAHFSVDAGQQKILKERVASGFNQENDETFALEAIRFVQDDIRYLGFEAGLNSHKPHPPLKVFDQRFGDCKDKSLLLCEILRSKDIEAYPVLVSTLWRDRIARGLPSINAFNHCVVQLRIDNTTYYVDPTLNNQGGTLGNNYFPYYAKGLVVSPSTTDLSTLPRPVLSDISEVQTISVPTLQGEAYLEVRTTYTGGEADQIRGELLNNGLESVQKNYLTFYANLYPDIEVASKMKTEDNAAANIFTVEETYKINTFWQQSEVSEEQMYAEVYPQTLENYFTVSKSPQRSAPYRLSYPLSYHHAIHVKLPEEWSAETDEELITTEYYDYAYNVRYDNREISLQTYYQTMQDHVPVEALKQFVDDHERMKENLSFQLSYNKDLIFNEKGISWLGLITALCALGVGLWIMLRLYYYYDPAPVMQTSGEGRAIGGWLILPAIGLLLNPFRLASDLYNLPEVYDSQMWANLWGMKRYALAIFIYIEHIYNVVFLLYTVLIGVLFFKRRSSLPRLITIYFAAGCLVATADTLVSAQIDSTQVQPEFFKGMIQNIIAAAIWIPYFNVSSRVKETFVARINDGDDDPEPLTVAEDYTHAPSTGGRTEAY